jgi:putative intracellular protease/amidase
LDRLLAKDPAHRFDSADEAAHALAAQSVPAAPPVRSVRSRQRTKPLDRRHWGFAIAGGIATVVLTAFALLVVPRLLDGSGAIALAPGKQVLFVIPPTQAWYGDYGPTKARLEAGGVKVVTASTVPGVCTLMPDARFPNPPEIIADVALQDVKAKDYDAIVFGGYQISPFIGQQPLGFETGRLLQEFRAAQKPIAGLCAGQAVLAHHHLLDGRNAAGGSKLAKSFPYEVPTGPRWTNEPVVVVDQGRLITGREDAFAQEFADAIVKALSQ